MLLLLLLVVVPAAAIVAVKVIVVVGGVLVFILLHRMAWGEYEIDTGKNIFWKIFWPIYHDAVSVLL